MAENNKSGHFTAIKQFAAILIGLMVVTNQIRAEKIQESEAQPEAKNTPPVIVYIRGQTSIINEPCAQQNNADDYYYYDDDVDDDVYQNEAPDVEEESQQQNNFWTSYYNLSAKMRSMERKLDGLKHKDDHNGVRSEHAIYKDCKDYEKAGHKESGVYLLTTDAQHMFPVYCENFDGHLWTVLLRRSGPELDFQRKWLAFKHGFGNLSQDFWLGLERMHLLTTRQDYILRIDLEDWENNTRHAQYLLFKVNREIEKYALHVANYSGTAGDSLASHSSSPFTTLDQDNDNRYPQNCAVSNGGGWWYNIYCDEANLNGPYRAQDEDIMYKGEDYGIEWDAWRRAYSFKSATMRITPLYDDIF